MVDKLIHLKFNKALEGKLRGVGEKVNQNLLNSFFVLK